MEASVEIRRPVETVFDYLADVRRHPQWQPDLLRAEPLGPQPLAVGSRVVESRRTASGTETFTYEVDLLRPPHELGTRTVSRGAVEPVARWRLEATAPERTRVSLTVDLHPNGPARLLRRRLERRERERAEAALRRLVALCEGTW